jgi:hypothetical protein
MSKGAHDVNLHWLEISWENIGCKDTLLLLFFKHLKHQGKHWQEVCKTFQRSMVWLERSLFMLKMKM